MGVSVKKIVIGIVTVLSLIALIFGFLLCFGVFGQNAVEQLYKGNGQEINANITFDTDELVYDGKAEFDAMQGVTAKDIDGKDITNMVSYSFSAGDNSKEKTINYSINSKEYSFATAKRTLKLENYTMPSMSVNVDSLKTDYVDLQNLISNSIASKEITAKDGYNNDISSDVRCNGLNRITSAGTYTITLSVENFLGDTATTECDVIVTGKEKDSASVVLTQYSTVINKNEAFNPLDYIESVTDENDNDVLEQIHYTSDVDVTKSGQYVVNYYVGDDEKIKATLNVVVS